MAGLAYSVYGYLDYIAREAVPFTATDEYLEAWAALVGIHRKDATAASGSARFTGTTGLVVPLGSGLTRKDGTPYVTTGDATVDTFGDVVVPMVATVTGAVTNCDDGTPIALDPPVSGVNSGGVTVGPTVGGADMETQEALRTRMLIRYANPPQGGSAADYIEWATGVPGCTRAWVIPEGHGPGSVVVHVMFDVANAASGGFPIGTDGAATDEDRTITASGDQLHVADAIWPVQPVTALVYVAAPIALPVDVTLSNLDPNTLELQTAIAVALDDMFLAKGEVAGTIYPSDIYEAVNLTPGVNHFVVASPTAPIIAGAGHLPVMGTLTTPP